MRVRGCYGACRATVTGPQVDVDPPVPAGQLRDLADVRLVRAAADDRAHGADGATELTMTRAVRASRRTWHDTHRGRPQATMRPSRSSTTRSARSMSMGSWVAMSAVTFSRRTTVRSSVMIDRPVPESS